MTNFRYDTARQQWLIVITSSISQSRKNGEQNKARAEGSVKFNDQYVPLDLETDDERNLA